jgi:ribosomal-protein-alanine N-acetyltransferase
MTNCTSLIRLASAQREPLASFFAELVAAGVADTFHPHPFTAQEAARICSYQGRDLYYALLGNTGEVLAYGMLRGWDEGYQIPSLGIAVHPKATGRGIGELMMRFLHIAAIEEGAKEIILKVYKNNHFAVRLYERLGYNLEDLNDKELRAVKRL